MVDPGQGLVDTDEGASVIQAAEVVLGTSSIPEAEAGQLTEAVAPESMRAASEGQPIMNLESGVYHRLVGSPPEAKIYCGWKHTSSPHVSVDPSSRWPTGWWQICGRCYPAQRLAAKARAPA